MSELLIAKDKYLQFKSPLLGERVRVRGKRWEQSKIVEETTTAPSPQPSPQRRGSN